MVNVYPYYRITSFNNFREFVDGMAGYGDARALEFYSPKGELQAYSYQTLAADVNALGAALMSQGMAGRHIAIVSENSYRWLVSLFAITSIGAVAVTVDIEQQDEIILDMIRRADSDAVIFSATFTALFSENKKSGNPLLLISIDDSGAADLYKFSELMSYGRLQIGAGLFAPKDIVIERDRPAMIVYTSGTTSVSKPVLLSHYNVQFNANNGSAMFYMGERIFTSLPMYHTYGLVCGVINNLSQGNTLIINGDIKTMMRDLKLANADCIVLVPLIAEAMLARIKAELRKVRPEYANTLIKSPARASLEFSGSIKAIIDDMYGDRLKKMICGGAYLDKEIMEQYHALGIEVYQGYGITECSPLVSVNRNEANRFGTIGLLLPETEVKFVDGEIWVKGPSVALGYYNDEEQTREAFVDGWFRTGDIGYMDRAGFLNISSRIKNLIVFKNGKKVAPEEIEKYVQNIPVISEAMAYGAAAGSAADDVKLVLMVYPDPELTRGMSSYEILQLLQVEIDKVNRNLPAYKQIQTIKLRDSEFEKTATKKIKRYTV